MPREEALRDARNNKSLLAEYDSLTKKLQADELGRLKVTTSDDNVDDIGDTLKKEGNLVKVYTHDENANGLLNSILQEMKIMNMHLAYLTDLQIRRQEVE